MIIKYSKIVRRTSLGLFGLAVFSGLVLQSCGGSGEPRIKDGEEVSFYESTKGVETEVEEIKPGGDYKILDERIIDKKENSVAIVHKLDGKVDTLSLKTLNKDGSNGGNNGLRNVLAASLAYSFFNRNLANTSPNAGVYKNTEAFNKSTGLKNDLTKTATSRKVFRPGGSSKGYGTGKSFRSHGG